MSNQLSLVLAVILLGFLLLYFLLKKQLTLLLAPKEDNTLLEWLKSSQATTSSLQSDLQKLQQHLTTSLQTGNKDVTDTLQKSYQQLHERLDNAAKIIGELKNETGKFSEIGRSMHDLQDFLNSPKLRGNIGEAILKDLLGQMLPKQIFSLQYHFKSGDIVDAIIKTQAGIIPIDSKFPMENFTKMSQTDDSKERKVFQQQFINDVKKHIRAISTKYIRTEEDTLDFALMYIPSETMYYEIAAISPEIQDYAQQKRVLPVSPATFHAFLRTILVSFEGQRIAREAQLILKNLRDVQKTTHEFGDRLSILQKHVSNAHSNMTAISSDFQSLQTKIDSTSSLPAPEEKLLP